ncbi:uncharacterized protein V3H82_023877 [Fundulus diaphanus]
MADPQKKVPRRDEKNQSKAQSNGGPSTKQPAEAGPSRPSSKRSSVCPTWCWPRQKTEPEEPVQTPQPESKPSKADTKPSIFRSLVPRIWTEDQEGIWPLVCPPDDKDAESKLWLKKSVENLNNTELKYFHRFLQSADKTKDGFAPIKRSRLQHAGRLDTVDLMIHTYPTNYRKVTEKIMEKISKHRQNEEFNWVMVNLDNLEDKELKYFHWFLQTADESKDGFKPMKKSQLQDADRMETADLMVQTYATNIKEVTKTIQKKIKSNAGKALPEAEKQMKPSSPAAAEEEELSKMLDQFVKKAPKETLTQLSEALVADGVLKSSEKENILQKNHTRANKASCLADTVMAKGTGACKKMIHHLQTVDAPLSSKLGLLSGPFAQQGHTSQEPKSKSIAEPGLAIQQFLGLAQKPVDDEKESWSQICPEGDNDADTKEWLKESLEDLDSREMKYFHWFLQTADKIKDGFKPIKKSRLEHADRLDTVDLMVQMYTTNTREVADKIFKKINKNIGHDLSYWLLDILEDLDDREIKYFHWFLQTADKSKDGFKAIKKSQLEGADRLDTVNLMVQTYTAKTKEVTEKIVEKIKSNKDNTVPKVESPPSSPPAAEEKVLTRMLNDFVEKVPKETFNQLMEALIGSKALKSSEKKEILQNHTRVNMASCFVDIVTEKGAKASKEVITRLQTIDPQLSTELRTPSSPGRKSRKKSSAVKKPRVMSKEQEECWRQICAPGDKDIVLKLWLKHTLDDLKNKELKYFHWYLRTADETKDGFKPIRRYRLKYAGRLDTLDLLLQMYSAKAKEVTEKILEKISSNKAQHLILEVFEEMGDMDLKYCQMLLQSTDKFMSNKKRVSVDNEEVVSAVGLMMQMYGSEHREELARALNEIQESTENLSEEEGQDSTSPAAIRERRIKNMLLEFIRKVSNGTLEQLLKDLVADKVLTASERKAVVEKNRTRVNKASCLIEMVKEKGSEASQKLLDHLQAIDAPLFSELELTQPPPLQQELLELLGLKTKEEGKTKDGEKAEEGDKTEEKGSDQ